MQQCNIKCNANIFFNKQCLSRKITPKYADIKVPITSKAAHITRTKVTTTRIKDEIKFLYRKKDTLNRALYQAHLQAAQEWGNTWPMIRNHTHKDINEDLHLKYTNQEQKLNRLEHTQISTSKHMKTFYPRVTNNTDIQFTTDEMKLLNKGLKYNLAYKNKDWTKRFGIETETAITQLPAHEQEYIRIQAAHNLQRLYTQHTNTTQYNSNHARYKHHTLNNIKKKVKSNNAIAIKADKGNSMVIMYTKDYHTKVQDFINNNSFTILNKDPTQSFQNKIKHTVRSCPTLLPGDSTFKLTNMNPTSPNIRGLPKIHKINSPIRPIVNWRCAPAYKLAKFLNKSIQLHITLPNAFNITNPTQLINELLSIPYKPSIKLASLDIENMYSNIPTNEIIPITKEISTRKQLDKEITNEIITITQTALQQNYLTFNSNIYSQHSRLAMGAPSSGILSEIYLQNLEHTIIYDILTQHSISGSFRYVDDIFLVYDENVTDIHKIHEMFNLVSSTIKFSLETENDCNINFLDISINNRDNQLTFNIHRKPTTTNIIIPADSCHPPEQKHAAIKHLTNRMNSYKLNHTDKTTEQHVIEQIVGTNGYDTSVIQRINKPKRDKDSAANDKNLWATFTYFGKETRTITKLFKRTRLRIAHKANNTIGQHLMIKTDEPDPQQQYKKSGIYCLTCPDCQKKYVGQTGRSFHKRYKEHFHGYKYNLRKTSFATHLLDCNHSIGPISEVMTVLYMTKKGILIDTIEKFHIYSETRMNNQINDKNTVKPNAIFDVIHSTIPLESIQPSHPQLQPAQSFTFTGHQRISPLQPVSTFRLLTVHMAYTLKPPFKNTENELQDVCLYIWPTQHIYIHTQRLQH
jgi:hypothetical protein